MSDSKLRELARRFHETGSVENEAAWLSERVRVGEIPGEHLNLLADLGYPAAKALDPKARERWYVGPWLAERTTLPEVRVRVEIAVVQSIQHHFDLALPEPEASDPRPLAALQAAEEWVCDPSSSHEAAAKQAARAARQLWFSVVRGPRSRGTRGRSSIKAVSNLAYMVCAEEGLGDLPKNDRLDGLIRIKDAQLFWGLHIDDDATIEHFANASEFGRVRGTWRQVAPILACML